MTALIKVILLLILMGSMVSLVYVCVSMLIDLIKKHEWKLTKQGYVRGKLIA